MRVEPDCIPALIVEHQTQVPDKALLQAKLHESSARRIKRTLKSGCTRVGAMVQASTTLAGTTQLTNLFGLPDGIGHRWCTGKRGSGRALRRKRELELVVCAIRRIRASEELFLDYALVVDGDDAVHYPCACRTRECRGTMEASAASSVF